MKTLEKVGISKIDSKNPNYNYYKRTISTWNKDGKFKVGNSFHAIYFGDLFLAACNMTFDKETSNVNISLLNGSSNNYDYIQEEATRQLTDLALEEYGKALVKSI